MRAYVLFEIEPGKVRPVVNAVIGVGYKDVCAVTGPYDAIAIVPGRSIPEINEINDKFHKIDGVIRTVTCLVTDGR